MTFAEIVTEISAPLNQTSSEATARIGRLVNRYYKNITTALGMQTSRRSLASSATMTIGSAQATFTSMEKVTRVYVTTSGVKRFLAQVTLDELRDENPDATDDATRWAVLTQTATGVVVLLDGTAQTAYTLYCDGYGTVSTLSGSQTPAFPESFHDILVFAVLKDEFRKNHKRELAKDYEDDYKERLSDLKMWHAKSGYLKTRQGERGNGQTSLGGGGGATAGEQNVLQTGLIRFNRGSGLAPFEVVDTDALYVANLGAEFIGNVGTDRLIGRDTAGTGESEQLSVGGGVEFTGSGGIQSSAHTGDVTKAAGGVATTIANDAVTFAKMQNIATNSLVGRDTASSGDPENILLNATLEMDGAGNLQRAALTGDVTASAGSNATTIPNDTVVFAKMQNIATDSLIGRDSASTGDPENILLNATLSMDGAGNLQRAALTGDVTASAGSNATTIANDAVTFAKMQNISAASRLLGRGSAAGSGDPEEIALGSGLSMSGTTLSGTPVGPTIQTTTATGAQNDFAQTSARHLVLRCNNASLVTFSGFVAGTEGDIIDVVSVNAQVEFDHQVTSSAANQLTNFVTVGNTPLAAGVGTARFVYDGTTSKWRMVAHEQGAWITPTFDAGKYSGGGGTWTVASGDVETYKFYLKGRQLTVVALINTSTVSGTTDALTTTIPGGFTTASGRVSNANELADNGTRATALTLVSSSGTTIDTLRQDRANFTAASDTTQVRIAITFEVI